MPLRLLMCLILLTACGRDQEVATVFDRDQSQLYGGEGLGTATPSASSFLQPDYSASNRADLYRIDQGTFVVRAAAADQDAFWCAAGEFAATALGLPGDARLWRIAEVTDAGFAVQGRGVRQIIPGPGQIFRTSAGDPGFLRIDNALRRRNTVAQARATC